MEIKTARSFLSAFLAPIGLLVLITFHLLALIPYQEDLRNSSFDLYQTIMPRERVSAPVMVVVIDEPSLKEYGQWPWPRSLLATLINRINDMQPAAIAVDIIMPEDDRTSLCEVTKYIPGIDAVLIKQACELPTNDAILAQAIKDSRAVLGIAGMEGDIERRVKAAPMLVIGDDPRPLMRKFSSALQNIQQLDDAAGGHAILSADMERGVIRRIPLVASVGDTVLPSLSLEVLRLASASPAFSIKSSNSRIEGVGIGELFIPTQEDGSTWVHYSHHDPGRFISALDVLNNTVDMEHLNRKLVLIGFSGLGLVDFPSTALGERVPGVEIHAQVLETIFDGTTLIRPYWSLWLEAAIMLCLAAFVTFGATRLRARIQVPVVTILLASLVAAGLLAFSRAQILIDVASPIMFFFLLYGTMLADSLIRDEEQIEVLEDDLRARREEAAKVRGEMEAAKRFQMGIIPDAKTTFINENRLDIAASMEPAKMVGGDLYDCFMLDEHRVFFSVGDVCGKGVPASLFMVVSKTICKSLVLREKQELIDLGAIVSQANKEVSRDNPEMLFVTTFVGIMDLRTGQLTYCNAGHERPFVSSAKTKPFELSGLGGPPIGTVDDWDYKTYSHKFSSEDFLCVYTDGVTEANNSSEDLFGHDRLISLLMNTNTTMSAESVLEKVREDVSSFVKDAEPYDDLTLMVLRWRGVQANES
ncbi:MAG: CHASE2 domain-containing protein [Cycloclasticus sp.]